MTASVSGSIATFKVSKIDGTVFTSDGTMYLKVGTYETYGADHGQKSVYANYTYSVSFNDNLDNYGDYTTKDFYARYEVDNEPSWAWVGKIRVTRSRSTGKIKVTIYPGEVTNNARWQAEIIGVSWTSWFQSGEIISGFQAGYYTDILFKDVDGWEKPSKTSVYVEKGEIAEVQGTYERIYTYSWDPGDWGPCSSDCGNGTQTRTPQCKDQFGNNASSYKCGSSPATSQSCYDDSNCQYYWDYGNWGQCSNTCGTGTQNRSAQCKDKYQNSAPNNKCPGSPETSLSCYDDSNCQYYWDYGNWGQCNSSCGCSNTCDDGTQTRPAYCKDKYQRIVEDYKCSGLPKTTTQYCIDESECDYNWSYGNWGQCSNTCGTGTQNRSAQCKDKYQNSAPNNKCPGSPETSQSCFDESGCRYEWIYDDDWGQCTNSCGDGTQTRSAQCKDQNKRIVEDYKCTDTPEISQKCTSESGCIYKWIYDDDWGQCTNSCGDGTQTRSAQCKDQNKRIVEDYKCTDTPEISQKCTSESGCIYKWIYDDWGQCTNSCGDGTQTRSAQCKDQNKRIVEYYKCTDTPEISQECTSESGCIYKWHYGDWGQCTNSCGDGTQTRSAQCKDQNKRIVADYKCTETPEASLPCKEFTYDWQEGLWGPCNADCNSKGNKLRDVHCKRCDGQVSLELKCSGQMPATSQLCYNECKFPLVTIDSHKNEQEVYESTIIITGTASDPDGSIEKVQIKLNDNQWQDASGTNNWSKNISLANGNNIILLKTKDNDGQWSEEVSISIIYTIPEEPIISLLTNSINIPANSGEMKIFVNNSGTGSLLWNVSIDEMSNSWLNITSDSAGSDGDGFIINYLSNNNDERTGKIIIIDDNATNSPQYISIIQAQNIIPLVYNVWLDPEESKIAKNSSFSLEIHADTGNQKLGSYQFDIYFDSNKINIDSLQGNKGVEIGNDGFLGFINDEETGKLIINGFDTYGKGPGVDLYILKVYFKTLEKTGSTNIDLSVPALTNELAETIGNPLGKGSIIQIKDIIIGDVDGNTKISIADALIVARYSAKLVVNTFIEEAADVNSDDKISIADALLIARKSAGLQSFRKSNYSRSDNIAHIILEPNEIEVKESTGFEIDINASISHHKIGSYQFELTFDPSLIEIDTSIGNNGVERGDDGFVSVVNVDNSKGTVIINGFDTTGIEPGDNLNIVKIHFIALQESIANTGLNLFVNDLTDELAENIEIKSVSGSTINVISNYYWQIGNWGICESNCNQTRDVWCEQSDRLQVDDIKCQKPKPLTSQTCDNGNCINNPIYTTDLNGDGQTNLIDAIYLIQLLSSSQQPYDELDILGKPYNFWRNVLSYEQPEILIYDIQWQGDFWMAKLKNGWVKVNQNELYASSLNNFAQDLQISSNDRKSILFDIDKDNKKELISYNYDRIDIYKLTNLGSNLLVQSNPDNRISETEYNNKQLIAEDFDNDGIVEIIYFWGKKDEDAGLVILKYNKLDNTLIQIASFDSMLDTHGYASYNTPAVGDINGDGIYEMAVSNDNGYIWIISYIENKFQIVNNFEVYRGGAAYVYLEDLDSDGICELIEGTNGGTVTIRTFFDNFNPVTTWYKDFGRLAYKVRFFNLDNNGYKNLIIAHSSTDTYYDRRVSVMSYDETNKWSVKWYRDTNDNFGDLIFTEDIDKNGTLELLFLILMILAYIVIIC